MRAGRGAGPSQPVLPPGCCGVCLFSMRYVAAYLLACLGGNEKPSAEDIKAILSSVGVEADEEKLNLVGGGLPCKGWAVCFVKCVRECVRGRGRKTRASYSLHPSWHTLAMTLPRSFRMPILFFPTLHFGAFPSSLRCGGGSPATCWPTLLALAFPFFLKGGGGGPRGRPSWHVALLLREHTLCVCSTCLPLPSVPDRVFVTGAGPAEGQAHRGGDCRWPGKARVGALGRCCCGGGPGGWRCSRCCCGWCGPCQGQGGEARPSARGRGRWCT